MQTDPHNPREKELKCVQVYSELNIFDHFSTYSLPRPILGIGWDSLHDKCLSFGSNGPISFEGQITQWGGKL